MSLTPDLWWPPAVLALARFVDAAMSLHPPKFIRDCLSPRTHINTSSAASCL